MVILQWRRGGAVARVVTMPSYTRKRHRRALSSAKEEQQVKLRKLKRTILLSLAVQEEIKEKELRFDEDLDTFTTYQTLKYVSISHEVKKSTGEEKDEYYIPNKNRTINSFRESKCFINFRMD